MSISDPSWKDQWERIARWRNRVAAAADGFTVPSGEPFTYEPYIDNAMGLMQAIWHLKDWLINDPALGIKRDEIEKFAHAQDALRIVRDLANGSKHMRIVDPHTDAKIVPGNVDLQVGGSTNTIEVHVLIESDGVTRDAVSIADDGIAAWAPFVADL